MLAVLSRPLVHSTPVFQTRDGAKRARLNLMSTRRALAEARGSLRPRTSWVHDRPVPVEAIHLGAPRKRELWTVETVRAVAGKGLEGDRHFHADGAPSGQALTLVAAEVVEEAGLQPGETRRQVTVRDVDVKGLVGKRFRVGEVECFGVELCEPCRHLERMTRPGI